MRARLHELMWWCVPRASILIDYLFEFCPRVTRVLFHRQKNLSWGLLKLSSHISHPYLSHTVLTSLPKCLVFALLSELQLPCCALLNRMLSIEQPLDLVHRLQDYKDYRMVSTESRQQQHDPMLHPASKQTPKQVSTTFMFPREQRWFPSEAI